ncbi:MAG: glycosyltransferase family 4 protein [Spongiibacteraceae bacterium]
MKVLQILPALNSGGVERGTVDFAGELVRRGHQSLVMSSGGAMVAQLETAGATHINFPVDKKSLKSLFKVRALRRLLLELDVDIIHVRSRVPAWMTWLALKKIPAAKRPALVSTFHGLYSINAYSAVMGKGDQVIAISQCVYDYIIENYPAVDSKKITIIHRGVDTTQFNQQLEIDADWKQQLFQQYPQLASKRLLLMPGRLSRWKGQEQFIEMMAELIQAGGDCHGVIVGGPTPGKDEYLRELMAAVDRRKLSEHITFLGHRTDIANIYGISSIVFNLSQHAEPFGRTVIEALAMGVPVVSYDYGGPAESLRACFPQGLVPLGDVAALTETVKTLLLRSPAIEFPASFTLQQQSQATLDVYHKALASRA